MKQNGLIVGLILAGLLGVAWIVLAATTGYGTALLGVVFGLIAGLCIRFCSGATHSPAAPLTAAMIAAVVVYSAGYFAPQEERPKAPVEEEITDEAMVVSAAAELADQWVMEGREVPWPEGVTSATASKQSDFPPALWQAALNQWRLTPPARKARCREMRKVNLQRTRDEDSGDCFAWVWGLAFTALAGVVAAATCVIGVD